MNILIVDDESSARESLVRLLSHVGPASWSVAGASSGSGAIQLMSECAPDVIITDLRMPVMDGTELLAYIMGRWPQVARIALSADTGDELAMRAAGLAHQLLGKPCSSKLLFSTLEALDALGQDEETRAARGLVASVPDLPVVPELFTELRRLLADVRTDTRQIRDVVRRDPSLAAKVMQLANSPYFTRGEQTADVGRAVARLGARLIANLVLAEGVLSAARLPARFAFGEEARWFFRASLVAEAAVSPCARDAASLAALLCPIGRLVMIRADPERADRVAALAAETGVTLATAERQLFGTSHPAVGAHLLSLWGLPPEVCAAVAAQHTAADSLDEVTGAARLAYRDVRGVALAPNATPPALVASWDRHLVRLEGEP